MTHARVFATACAAGLMIAAPARGADWQYSLAPYVWSAGTKGTQGVAGQEAKVDASFSDILEFVDAGFAAHLEAKGSTWGWFGDVFYAKLSDEKNVPVGTLGAETKQTVLEAGLSRPFTPELEALVGLRYQKSTMKFGFSGLGSIAGDEDWLDGFVGLRWTPVNNDQWRVWLRGDIGAGGSDLVWFASAGAEYRFSKAWSLLVGYRYLDTDYENGGFKWDIAQSGLGLGVGYTW